MWYYLRKNSATISVEPFSVIACFWAWDVAAMVFKSKISKMIWVTLTYQLGQSQQSLQYCRDSTSSGGRNSWSCNHSPQKINFISFSILIVQLHPMRLRGMFISQLWVFMLLWVHIPKANLKKLLPVLRLARHQTPLYVCTDIFQVWKIMCIFFNLH